MARTRIAPTPSGYLHEGNCVNFLLTDWLAKSTRGHLRLRLDDIDADRYRFEYAADVFRVLSWLDIECDAGPRDAVEFEQEFSLRHRADYYLSELQAAQANGLATYACRCSRAQLRASGSLACVSGCRERGIPWHAGESALRVHVLPGTAVRVGDAEVDVAAALGDFVLVRRDGQPSYQVASLIEDRDAGTTHIVRGEDLLASSAAQLLLAPAFGADDFTRVEFRHHQLISDASGHKLSKSQIGTGPLECTPERRDLLVARAAELAADVGITPAS